jgi:hypothetical protein
MALWSYCRQYRRKGRPEGTLLREVNKATEKNLILLADTPLDYYGIRRLLHHDRLPLSNCRMRITVQAGLPLRRPGHCIWDDQPGRDCKLQCGTGEQEPMRELA